MTKSCIGLDGNVTKHIVDKPNQNGQSCFCESGWTDREISLELHLILIASKMCLALENGVDDDDAGVGDDDDQEDVGEYQQFEARLV